MPSSTLRTDLRAAGATDIGRQRTNNEDRFLVDVPRGIFVVVDGIGGHAAGDRAADAAIASMTERLTRQTGTTPDRLREAITIANNDIHRLAATRPEWSGMACVLTAVVIDGDHAVVGHVGDSRLYRLHDNRIEKITPDHSPIGEREDAHELTELEAMRHPRRNEVYRDVGSEARDVSDEDFSFVSTIDFPEGAALLLCSDGLTDLLPSEEIRRTVADHAGAPEVVVRQLIAAANAAGGKDNVTVVYVERGGLASNGRPASDRTAASSRDTHRSWGRVAGILALVLTAALAGWTIGARPGWIGLPAMATSTGEVVVHAGESIMDAVTAASPGTTIIVEPGEYRERVTLRDHVRIVSRVPRGAVLRLPSGATEGDAAVVASGTVDAELNGFRIVGDAATALGVGIVSRNAGVRLVDLDIAGATVAALDLGPGEGVTVTGSDARHNPGAAVILRAGASARLSNNVFSGNATSEHPIAAIIIEPTAEPIWLHNVFDGMDATAIAGLDATGRAALARDNWFLNPAPPARRTRGASGAGGAR
ncbi:MAG: protein phosphatase 2C domain-containing protein [Acidobacteriota bacterium]